MAEAWKRMRKREEARVADESARIFAVASDSDGEYEGCRVSCVLKAWKHVQCDHQRKDNQQARQQSPRKRSTKAATLRTTPTNDTGLHP